MQVLSLVGVPLSLSSCPAGQLVLKAVQVVPSPTRKLSVQSVQVLSLVVLPSLLSFFPAGQLVLKGVQVKLPWVAAKLPE